MSKLQWLTGRLPEPEYLPTPSFGLNRALGGKGLRSGRIHIYWGPRASGKSTVALHQVAVAQQEGKTCAYIDAEKTFDPEWAEKCGVDVDALKIVQANSAEAILTLLLPDMVKEAIDVVVVDSLSSINYEAFFDPEKNPMGSYARSSKMFTHKVLNVLGYNQQIIFISHAAMDLSGHHPMLTAAIGNGVGHWASTIIKIQKVMSKDSIRESDGAHVVRWQVDKSKQSEYPVSGQFYFVSHTASIDNVDEVVSIAKEEGIIEGAGAWVYHNKGYEDEQKWNGQAKLVQFLKENDDFYQQLQEELNAIKVVADEEEED